MSSRKFEKNEGKGKEDKRNKIQLFECKKYGHVKHECPKKEKEERKEGCEGKENSQNK